MGCKWMAGEPAGAYLRSGDDHFGTGRVEQCPGPAALSAGASGQGARSKR